MGRGHHLRTCVILLLLACAVEAWSVWRAVVPAQDVVRFVAVAQAVEQQGARDVWRNPSGPPLFPTVVALVHRGLQQLDWQWPDAWARSAQLAAAGALVLAVVPFYGLMVCWRGSRQAVIAATLFCFLPELVRLGGDGLSDSLFLLLLLLAWWFAAWCIVWACAEVERGSENCWSIRLARSGLRGTVWFYGMVAFCGAVLAVATWVHRQAWLAMIALLAALMVGTGWRRWKTDRQATKRRPRWMVGKQRSIGERYAVAKAIWKTVPEGAAAAAFVLGGVVVWSMCVAWLTPLAGDALQARLAGRFDPDRWAVLNAAAVQPEKGISGGQSMRRFASAAAWTPRSAERLSPDRPARDEQTDRGAAETGHGALPHVPAKETEITSRRPGYRAAMLALVREMASASQYWIGGLALLGLWTVWRREWQPIDRAVAAYMVVGGLGTLQHAATSGYLSTRHVLPLAVLALGWTACGIETASAWLAQRWSGAFQGGSGVHQSCTAAGRLRIEAGHPLSAWRKMCFRLGTWGGSPAVMCWVVVLVAVAACWPRIARPLHASREAHRRVGDWLARADRLPGHVLDSRGWSALYSGRTTYRMQAADDALASERLAYIVLEQGELRVDTRRGRRLRSLLQRCGSPVARFRHPTRPNRDDVLVFRWRVPAHYVEATRIGVGAARGLGAAHIGSNRSATICDDGNRHSNGVLLAEGSSNYEMHGGAARDRR